MYVELWAFLHWMSLIWDIISISKSKQLFCLNKLSLLSNFCILQRLLWINSNFLHDGHTTGFVEVGIQKCLVSVFQFLSRTFLLWWFAFHFSTIFCGNEKLSNFCPAWTGNRWLGNVCAKNVNDKNVLCKWASKMEI